MSKLRQLLKTRIFTSMRPFFAVSGIYILLLVLMAMSTASCVTARRVDYLQDMTQGSQIEIENRFEAMIAPYDELSIIVKSSNVNTADLASPFNQGETGTYLVDVNGDITLPIRL